VRLINLTKKGDGKIKKNEVRYMDFERFKDLIVQIGILGFSRGEKDLSNLPPLNSV